MMENENRDRNVPDISFGAGAPAGMLEPESAPKEEPISVSLEKPSAEPAPAPVLLDKPAQAAAPAQPAPIITEKPAPVSPPQQKPAGKGQKPALQGRPPLRKKKKPPVGASNERANIGANFGSNTPERHGSMTAPFEAPADEDRTKNFSAAPHGERIIEDVSPENEDVTRHFGKTARRERAAETRAERPVRRDNSAVINDAERPAPQRRRRPAPRKKKKEHMLNTSIITGLTITIVVISASIVLATQGIMLGMEYLGYNKSDKEVTFNIPEGADSEDIIDLLIENNIINNRKLFKLALRVGDTDILYPGDITLSPNKSYPEIISLISKQRELFETVTLTFAEGTNLRAVAAKLEKNGVCNAKDFLWQFNKKLDLPLDSKINHSSDVYLDMEGYFFPDTYEFYKNDSPYNVAKTVRENFDKKITADMYTRMSEMGMDLNQVVTLASIVQSEAGNAEQMPIIASIFLNRLKDSQTFPNLQSDATKNYVTNVIDRVETSTAMLEHYTNVYDTYVCFGLPAGPVCNPGLEAINAVLHPADTDYYYFCNNLETGEAFYAETYEQHQKNLKKAGLKE